MVHALKLVHRLLQWEGLLINFHDIPAPHVLEVHSTQTIIKAGWLLDSKDFDSERFGFNALAQVVSEGYFMLVDEREFSANMYMDDVQELQDWLAEWWEAAILSESTIQRIEEIFQQVGQPANVVLKVPARMTKLRAIR